MKSDDIPMYDDPGTPVYMRELLQAGRHARSDYDAERGLAEHLARIGAVPISPAAPAAHWGASAAAAAKISLPAWLGFVVLPLAAASVVGWLWVSGAAPTPARAPSQLGNSTRAPSESAAPAVGSGVAVAGSVRREPAGIGSAASDSRAVSGNEEARSSPGLDRRTRIAARSPAAHAATRPVRAASGERNGSESAASDLKSVSAASVKQDSAPAPVAEQDTQAVEERAEADAAPTKKPAAVAVVDESRLEREMQMLAVTQRVLSSNPERALRLAQQGEREFAGSMFSAERRQLGLLALVKLGRVDEARRAGGPFLARYPNAPWSERLRRALSTGTVE